MPLPQEVLNRFYKKLGMQSSETFRQPGKTEIFTGTKSTRYAVMYRCDGCGELHPVPDLGFESIKDLWKSSDYIAKCPDTGEVTVLQGAINVVMVAQDS